jgi:hypothetical protein
MHLLFKWKRLLRRQVMTYTITSSPEIYWIFYFQQTSGIHAALGKRKGCSLSVRSPAPIADSFHVATMERKYSVLNLREINKSNTHVALASVLTYYLILIIVVSRLVAAGTMYCGSPCLAVDVFTQPFPGNGCLCWFYNFGFQQTCYNIELLIVFLSLMFYRRSFIQPEAGMNVHVLCVSLGSSPVQEVLKMCNGFIVSSLILNWK